MRKYPSAFLGLVGASALAAALLIGDSFRRYGLPMDSLWTFLALASIASLTTLYPVRSAREHVFYSLCNMFVFAAVLLLPPSWTALLCVVIWLPNLPQRFRQWHSWQLWIPPLTNASQLVMLTALTRALLDYTGAHPPFNLHSVMWVSFAVVLYVAAQTLYVSLLNVLYRRLPWRSLDMIHIDSILSDLLLVFLGVVVAVLWMVHPALIILAGIAMGILYRMMRSVQLIRQAELDPKTGVYNIRYFEEQLKAEVKRSVALRRPTSLIFADLDYLRSINNSFGHQAGDAAIQVIAGIFKEHAGKTGIPARFGGEEFVLLLPGVDVHEASYLAERMREAVQQVRIPVEGDRVLSCTMSFGVAACPDDATTSEMLMKAADDAVYAAKHGGRNRVCVSNDHGKATVTIRELDGYAASRPEIVGGQTPAERNAGGGETLPVPAPTVAAQLLFVTTFVAATAVLAWSVVDLQRGTNWWALVALATLAGGAEAFKVTTLVPDGTRGSLSVTMAIALGTGTYLGVAPAVLVNLVSAVVHVWGSSRREMHKPVMNLCMAILSAAAGALPHELIGFDPASGIGYVATVVGAFLYYLVNIGLMVLWVAASDLESPMAVWRRGMAYMTPHYLTLTLAGGFIARFYSVLGWPGTLTLVGLLLLIRRTFQQQVRHMDTSLRALKEARDLLARANRLEKQSLRELTESVSAIIDARDASVYGHSRQVARYAVALAEEMGIKDPAVLDEIRTAALLHDLGKVGVPEVILHKPSRLTPEEYEIVKQHAAIGQRILSGVETLRNVALLVGAHHEFWNGRGYPQGQAGETIPLGARIIAVADTLDSILTDRPYSRARPLSAALEELRRCAGTQFDPVVVTAADSLARRWPLHYFRNPLHSDASTALSDVASGLQPVEQVSIS